MVWATSWRSHSSALWFHLYLLLSEGVLALRERQAGTKDDSPLAATISAQCKSLRGERCRWMECKHEAYKERLEARKQQAEVRVKADFDLRSMSAQEAAHFLEGHFLARVETERNLHKAIAYALAGETQKCDWAEVKLEEFDEWLETLLPSRHKCVQKVVERHGRTKEICHEGYSNNFKAALRKNCEGLDFPDQLSESQARSKWRRIKELFKVKNPYKAADKAVVAGTVVAAGTGATFLGITLLCLVPYATMAFLWLSAVLSAIGFIGTAVIPILTLGVVVPALAYLICRRGSKKSREGYHHNKWVAEGRPES